MKKSLLVPVLLALFPSGASAADRTVSFGLSGGGLFTDQLEAFGDSAVVAPRLGYWINPTLGFELDVPLFVGGQTQVGIPETFKQFGTVPTIGFVGRTFEDQPISILLEVGVGGFVKSIDDAGALGLPTGTNMDLDFAGLAGPGLLLPLGSIAIRTEYRWMLTVGTENWQNRGDSFINGMWTLGLMYLPAVDKDADKDGIVDDTDKCVDQAEDMDEYEDQDGCPESDNDNDGVADTSDTCANEAEDLDQFEDEDGCPDLDNDGDKVPDATDTCPNDAGSEAAKGCPDADGDAVVDTEDECVDEAGAATSFGCPDRDTDRVPDYRDECPDEKAPEGIDASRSDGCVKKFYLAADKVVITEKIQFDSGKAVVKTGSFEMLDGIAAVLTKNPGIKKLQIEGHTDSEGDDAKNLKLSQDRADAVKAYLVSKGVAADRLVAKGFGETKPIGDNATAEGREQNRRVEMNIEEQDVGKRVKQRVREGVKEGNVEKMAPEAPAPAPAPAAPAPAPAAPAPAPAAPAPAPK